jgi:hypothetical protein
MKAAFIEAPGPSELSKYGDSKNLYRATKQVLVKVRRPTDDDSRARCR